MLAPLRHLTSQINIYNSFRRKQLVTLYNTVCSIIGASLVLLSTNSSNSNKFIQPASEINEENITIILNKICFFVKIFNSIYIINKSTNIADLNTAWINNINFTLYCAIRFEVRNLILSTLSIELNFDLI